MIFVLHLRLKIPRPTFIIILDTVIFESDYLIVSRITLISFDYMVPDAFNYNFLWQ